ARAAGDPQRVAERERAHVAAAGAGVDPAGQCAGRQHDHHADPGECLEERAPAGHYFVLLRSSVQITMPIPIATTHQPTSTSGIGTSSGFLMTSVSGTKNSPKLKASPSRMTAMPAHSSGLMTTERCES